jgi:hypothetical protein
MQLGIYGRHILGDYFTGLLEWRNLMGSNGLPDSLTGYRDATALMQGGKLYD